MPSFPSLQTSEILVRPIVTSKPVLELCEQLGEGPFLGLPIAQDLCGHAPKARLELGRLFGLVPPVGSGTEPKSLGKRMPSRGPIETVHLEPLLVRPRPPALRGRLPLDCGPPRFLRCRCPNLIGYDCTSCVSWTCPFGLHSVAPNCRAISLSDQPHREDAIRRYANGWFHA